jgi:hypothetical protein
MYAENEMYEKVLSTSSSGAVSTVKNLSVCDFCAFFVRFSRDNSAL